MSKPLIDIFEYNLWANRTLLEACRAAPEAALTAEVPGISAATKGYGAELPPGQKTPLSRAAQRNRERGWG